MESFTTELKQWVNTIQKAWEEIEEREKQLMRAEQVKIFEIKLQQLLAILNDGNRALDLEKISQNANELYEIWNDFIRNEPIPIGGHVLPSLPYPYESLEPYIAKEIMELHHKVHHQGYVNGLNKAEKMLQQARKENDYDLIKHWSRELAFHGAGHYLHSIFWNNMSPKGGGEPKGDLESQIKKDFGSFDDFKQQFSKAAENVEGVGWAMLVWSPRSHRLEILQVEKHQNLSQQDIVPILVLDVWEHAYYLQYKTDKKAYINNWWNIVNWSDASKRFREAEKLRWEPY